MKRGEGMDKNYTWEGRIGLGRGTRNKKKVEKREKRVSNWGGEKGE